MPAAPPLPSILMITRVQDFSETFGQIGRPENFRQEQNRPTRILMLRDRLECVLQRRIRCELFGAGKKPGINFRVDGAQFRLQPRRVAFGVVHQKTWIDAEESRQQFAGRVRQVWPRAILDLREIRLAQTAANFVLHRSGQFLLGHRTAQPSKGTLDCAEGAKFVTKFHGRLTYSNLQIYYYISLFCQAKSAVPHYCPILFIVNELEKRHKEKRRRRLVYVANPIHSGFLSDCRSIPSCWHFLYRWLRSKPKVRATLVMWKL